MPSRLSSARRPALRTSASPRRPSHAMVRFSPMSGATSAIVPIAAIFISESIEIFLLLRRINSQHSLNATPTPARSLNGYSPPGCFGLSNAAGLGRVPRGRDAGEASNLEPVAVDEPMRHDERDVGAEGSQHGLQKDDRGDAVDVVVAIDDDRFAIAHRALDALARVRH